MFNAAIPETQTGALPQRRESPCLDARSSADLQPAITIAVLGTPLQLRLPTSCRDAARNRPSAMGLFLGCSERSFWENSWRYKTPNGGSPGLHRQAP